MIIIFSGIAAVIPMLLYLMVIWRFDRYDREPILLVLINYFWGAVGAVTITLLLNSLIHYFIYDFIIGEVKPDYLASIITAPIIEEMTKGFFLLIMVQNKKFDNITDGIVYGGAIGLGFGMTENFFYFIANSSSVKAWLLIVIIRTLFSAVMHCVATGTLGAFLGYAKIKNGLGKISSAALGLLIAITIHSTWNSFVSYQSTAMIGIVFMIITIMIFILVFTLSVNSERKIIFSELLEESEAGLIPLYHLNILNSPIRNKSGWVDEGVRKTYISSAIKLAFIKMQYKNSQGIKKNYYETEIDNLRRIIANLLGKA